jgi:hypothetical protein
MTVRKLKNSLKFPVFATDMEWSEGTPPVTVHRLPEIEIRRCRNGNRTGMHINWFFFLFQCNTCGGKKQNSATDCFSAKRFSLWSVSEEQVSSVRIGRTE